MEIQKPIIIKNRDSKKKEQIKRIGFFLYQKTQPLEFIVTRH